MCVAGSRTTPPGTPATSRRPTACVRAAWWERRATSSAAPRSTLPPSSWGERAPVSGAATPTPRSTCLWPWAAPVCRCCRKRGTHTAATRAWREPGLKPGGRSCLQGRKGEDSSFCTSSTSVCFLYLPLSLQTRVTANQSNFSLQTFFLHLAHQFIFESVFRYNVQEAPVTFNHQNWINWSLTLFAPNEKFPWAVSEMLRSQNQNVF